MLFESFLANNVKFGSIDEVLLFINNVTKEERKYDDYVILDKPVDIVDCFVKIIDSCGYLWMPDEQEMDIIWRVLHNLNQNDINRVYYKNNLYEFCNNDFVIKLINQIMITLKEPFFDPLTVPESIQNMLDDFTDLLGEYVYYGKMIIDRIDRCSNMVKSTIVISDTDSCIISLDAWYRFVLERLDTKNVYLAKCDPTDIFTVVEKDEFGDVIDTPFVPCNDEETFDFMTDEIRYQKYLINPFEILPHDYIKWSIVNILAYAIDKFINRYMIQFTKNNHSWAPDKPCKIIMKNEFSFNRILLTNTKKTYATIQKVQEGKLIPKEKQLDVKGINCMAKSTTAKTTRDAFKKIMMEEILTAPAIDQFKIVEKLCIMEKKIYNSLMNGSKEYYKPLKIKGISNYDNPMSNQGIKASYVWNCIKDDELPGIDLEERNAIDIVKVYINKNNVEDFKDTNPELYEKLCKVLDSPYFKGKIDSIAIPEEVAVPEWLTDLIDYKTIINDNMKGFITPSIGLTRLEKNCIFSNVIQL